MRASVLVGPDRSALVAIGQGLYMLENLKRPTLRPVLKTLQDQHKVAGDPDRRRAFVATGHSQPRPGRTYLSMLDLDTRVARQNIGDLGSGGPLGLHYLPAAGRLLYWGGRPSRMLVVDPDTGKVLHRFDGAAHPLRLLRAGPRPLVVVGTTVFDVMTGGERGELPDLPREGPATRNDGTLS